jgi:hypothetical protein
VWGECEGGVCGETMREGCVEREAWAISPTHYYFAVCLDLLDTLWAPP